MQVFVDRNNLLLILFCCFGLISCTKKVYKPDDFLITKPSWIYVDDKEYKFIEIGIADNVGNIGDILQSAQHNAINKISYLIFKKVFDIVDNCVIDENDNNLRIYKRQFLSVMNGFDKDFDLKNNTFIVNNWLNPDDNRMYVKVVANTENVINRIVYLIDNEIKVAKETARPYGYITFLQYIKDHLVADDVLKI